MRKLFSNRNIYLSTLLVDGLYQLVYSVLILQRNIRLSHTIGHYIIWDTYLHTYIYWRNYIFEHNLYLLEKLQIEKMKNNIIVAIT